MLWLLLDYSKRIHYSEIMYNKGDAYDKEKKELILLVYRQHLDKEN